MLESTVLATILSLTGIRSVTTRIHTRISIKLFYTFSLCWTSFIGQAFSFYTC